MLWPYFPLTAHTISSQLYNVVSMLHTSLLNFSKWVKSDPIISNFLIAKVPSSNFFSIAEDPDLQKKSKHQASPGYYYPTLSTFPNSD